MATKRPAPSVHPSRADQVPAEPSRKRRKPNLKANAPGSKTFKKAHPVNELKSRIRSLRRQLERNGSLSAVLRQEKERALRAAEDELERNERAKKSNEMIAKWHKVRFFDRRKAEKRLKKARKELDAVDEENGREVVEQRVRDAEVDVKYAIYYPLEKDYVPLFPRRQKAENDDDGEVESAKEVERKGDAEMWERVKWCMAEGTLDALRHGRLEAATKDDDASEAASAGRKTQPKDLAKARKNNEPAESGEESDEGGAGFWE